MELAGIKGGAGATGKSQVRSDGETGRFTEVIVQAGKA